MVGNRRPLTMHNDWQMQLLCQGNLLVQQQQLLLSVFSWHGQPNLPQCHTMGMAQEALQLIDGPLLLAGMRLDIK